MMMIIAEGKSREVNLVDPEGTTTVLQEICRKLDVLEARLVAIEKRSAKCKGGMDGTEKEEGVGSGMEMKQSTTLFERLQEEDSFLAYAESFEALVNRVELSEEEMVAKFMKGLTRDNSKLIRILNPKTLRQAIAFGKILTSDDDPYKSKGRTSDMLINSDRPVSWSNAEQEGNNSGSKTWQDVSKGVETALKEPEGDVVDGTSGTPVRVVQNASPDLGTGDVCGNWRIDDTDNSFYTQPMRVKYARQDVLLSIVISFNLSLNKFDGPPTFAVLLKNDLMDASLSEIQSGLHAFSDSGSVAIHEFWIPPKALIGLHSYGPVYFDAFHAVLVDTSVHIILLRIGSGVAIAVGNGVIYNGEDHDGENLGGLNKDAGVFGSINKKQDAIFKAVLATRNILLEELKSLSEVTGFSIGGRVVDGIDNGVKGVKIIVDGHERSVSDKEGSYKLNHVTSNQYTIQALKEHYKFEVLKDYLVLPNMAGISDIKSVSYDVCGVVRMVANRHKVKVTLTHGPENVKPQVKHTDESGNFCFEVQTGEYRLSALASTQESVIRVIFSSPYADATVKSPLFNVEFSEALVSISGSVDCKKNGCPSISATLVRLGYKSGEERKTFNLTEVSNEFMFPNIFPGEYHLKVKHGSTETKLGEDNWRWEQGVIEVDLIVEDVKGFKFSQNGYLVNVISSHDVDSFIKLPDDSPVPFKIKKGSQHIYAEFSGVHELFLGESFVRFGSSSVKIDMTIPSPVYIKGEKYLLKGHINVDLSYSKPTEEIAVDIMDSAGKVIHTTMLGEVFSSACSSLPVDVQQSIIEGVRREMDVFAFQNRVVKDSVMSRFYDQFFQYLHVLTVDAEFLVADHVSSFITALRFVRRKMEDNPIWSQPNSNEWIKADYIESNSVGRKYSTTQGSKVRVAAVVCIHGLCKADPKSFTSQWTMLLSTTEVLDQKGAELTLMTCLLFDPYWKARIVAASIVAIMLSGPSSTSMQLEEYSQSSKLESFTSLSSSISEDLLLLHKGTTHIITRETHGGFLSSLFKIFMLLLAFTLYARLTDELLRHLSNHWKKTLENKDNHAHIKILVHWQNGDRQDATWEYLFDLQAKYQNYTLEDKGVYEGRVLMHGYEKVGEQAVGVVITGNNRWTLRDNGQAKVYENLG